MLVEIRAGRPVEIAALCRQMAQELKAPDLAKGQPCTIRGEFLRKIVTHAKDYETDPDGVVDLDLREARIEGPIVLSDTQIDRSIHVVGGTIVGGIDLSRAKATKAIILRADELDDDLMADGLESDFGFEVSVNKIAGRRKISLDGANIKAGVDIHVRAGEALFTAPGLQVDGSLDMSGGQVDSIDLQDARISGSLLLNGLVVTNDVKLDRIQVGSTLSAKATTTTCSGATPHLGSLSLAYARIAIDLQMSGIELHGPLNLVAAQVGRDLSLAAQPADHEAGICNQRKVLSKLEKVDLHYADIRGSLLMDEADIRDDFSAVEMKIGGDVSSRDLHFYKDVTLANAMVEGNLDLQGANLGDLDLSGAKIVGTAHLANDEPPFDHLIWLENQSRSGLTLTDAHIGILAGALRAKPTLGMLHLSGASISHIPVDSQATADQWDDWIRRDTRYVPSIYEQLAAAFSSAGFADMANEIRYAGRVRQTEELNGLNWWVSQTLRAVAGFGIGVWSFYVLYWIGGITLAGAVYLRFRQRPARQIEPKGDLPLHDGSDDFVWCIGATLSRLLPFTEINEEFKDFFKDPERRRLTGLQSLIFSSIGLVGWLLGIILLGALSGLLGKA